MKVLVADQNDGRAETLLRRLTEAGVSEVARVMEAERLVDAVKRLDPAVMVYLSASGATVFPVTPYRYASDSETDAVADAIRQMADGAIDVIAFTSKPQVSRPVGVAKEKGLEAALALDVEPQ